MANTKILFTNAPILLFNGECADLKFANFKSKIHTTMKIFFDIDLFKIIDTSKIKKGVRAGSRWPFTFPANNHNEYFPYPFLMGYSAALLKENGFNVDILDAVVEDKPDYKKYIKQVKSTHADIVVIECSEITINVDLWCAKEISKFAQVALAGPHFTDELAKQLQKENPYIKYFLKGEYIKSSLKMAQTRKEGIYDSEIITDLDSIPFPYRDYKYSECYFDPSMPTARPQLQIYSSKGCPFKCKFCMWPQTMYKGNVAQRTPKKVAEEIKSNVEKYGYKSIFFDDDTFNVGTERISELCDYLKEIGLPWTMMGRLDCSPNWLYDKMVDCGCVGMRFGVETFNLDCLKKIHKGIERVDFQGTLKYISEKHPEVWIHLTMMKDMPGQTEEIHKKDMQILSEMGYELGSNNPKRSFQLSTCVPYKGTQLYREMEELLGSEFLKKNIKYDGGEETFMTELNKQGFWEKVQ